MDEDVHVTADREVGATNQLGAGGESWRSADEDVRATAGLETGATNQ
ncbi:MAG: hypothetical protein WCF54_10410 [Terracidiphilus sp.]